MTAPRAPFTAPDAPIRRSGEPIDVVKLGLQDYEQMWHRQADIAAQRANDEIHDQLLMLEHPSIYTAGKRTQPEDRPTNGLPVIDVDRGGRITWHGPGQLVCYPIIKLNDPVDVVDYVRRVEEALIQVVRQLGVTTAGRIDGRSGVWVPASDGRADRKIAALGIRITRGVSMHGLALNCNNTLEYYDHIVPCGIDDAGVTTLAAELGRDVTVDECIEPISVALIDALEGRLTVADHTFGTAPDPCKGLGKRKV
ncbi:lipoyl(octanoyl) transferase LipB [Corynebacterium epidermidicanis]|uniref:Octanoyltransferase n=1 Tax=Corynebacterium epidermidicanis TaxID=1050174 RepID=A0A0G3GVJ6_9CORY|nr:lipoyl(octanoyl) transferase LipB [Corynebacterium epidermidicanis]AKK03568.1 lipoate-protein ligase B [Corynebacterium epidermidicanis]